MLAEAAGGLEAEEGGGEDHARTLHAAQLVRQHLPGEIQLAYYQLVPQIDPSVKLYNHGEGPY